ncbi:hypothetical protein COM40_21180 [Bacillus wiedmannii]|nr:hypothetical protein COM40_21180 [Bacillus wiedmannii]
MIHNCILPMNTSISYSSLPLNSLSPSTNSYISIQFVLSIHSYNLSPDTLFCSIQTSYLHSASLSVN